MAVHIVIPARYGSTRLPGKPLVEIGGQPMVVRVAQRAAQTAADDVVVAVDDERVATVVERAGFSAVFTDSQHASGSDRSMEVAQLQGWQDDDLVINVQGDEPLIPVSVIDCLIDELSAAKDLEMATIAEPLGDYAAYTDPNVVKVVVDDASHALYFSRASVPFARDLTPGDVAIEDWNQLQVGGYMRRHVGIYGFRVSGLRAFVELGPSALEKVEMLEQLRWLQAGRKLLVVAAAESVPGGVDTPSDLERVRSVWSDAGD
ncbi:MAG: 3-deoxy-manno-octulosonate cytidylyltransferase [Gammaproteobacteria bacterium TMED92]|nr:MAG: 3-deoxy-manno-octulosonate cytidylyltransferase [Gammaproteobacteria bacterium TMED92]